MPNTCAVPKCGKRGGHLFPVYDNELCSKWITAIRRPASWWPSDYSAVCFDHFDPTDYAMQNMTGHLSKYKRLKKGTVPRHFVWTKVETPDTSEETPKRTTPKGVTPKIVTPKGVTPKIVTPKGVTPKIVTPKGVTPKIVTPKGVTPKIVTPKGVTPKIVTPKGVTPQIVTPKGVTPKIVTPEGVTPKIVTPKGVTPKRVTSQGITPQVLTPEGVTPKSVIAQGVTPRVFDPLLFKHVISQEAMTLIWPSLAGEVVKPPSIHPSSQGVTRPRLTPQGSRVTKTAELVRKRKNPRFESGEERKKAKQDQERQQRMVNLGSAWDRWMAVKVSEGLDTDEETAIFLLNRYENHQSQTLMQQQDMIPIKTEVVDTEETYNTDSQTMSEEAMPVIKVYTSLSNDQEWETKLIKTEPSSSSSLDYLQQEEISVKKEEKGPAYSEETFNPDIPTMNNEEKVEGTEQCATSTCPAAPLATQGEYRELTNSDEQDDEDNKCFVVKAETGEVCHVVKLNKEFPETIVQNSNESEEKKKGKRFQCNECEKSFARSEHLKTHKLTHSGEKVFQCDECEKYFARAGTLKEHKLTHTGLKPFQCDQCYYTCSRNSVLTRHKLRHTGKPFRCAMCNYSCVTTFEIKRHQLTHTQEKPFKCDECDSSFSQKGNLNLHKTTHSEEKTFKCNVCDAAYARKAHLKRHKMTHSGEKPFQCDECDYKCILKYDLKKHKRVHTGEKTFLCDQCEYSALTITALNIHKLIHAEVKPFQCDECDYTCINKRNLENHRLKHTGERPFKCDQCGSTYAHENSLRRHKANRSCGQNVSQLKPATGDVSGSGEAQL